MDKKRAWLGQPHLIENLRKKFGNCVKRVQSHNMGMTKFLIVRPMIKSEKISIENKKEYQLGVDM